MNLKKIIVNSLAVVGAVVIIDKLVEVVTEKATKIISEDMLDECPCEECVEFDEEDDTYSFENDDDYNESFPDIKKYENSSEGQTFQYAVKAENITSEGKEV